MPRYEGRAALVRRLAAILLYTSTSRQKPNPVVIARGLGVHPRTVIRDLEALEEAGWPMPEKTVAENRHEDGRFKVVQ